MDHDPSNPHIDKDNAKDIFRAHFCEDKVIKIILKYRTGQEKRSFPPPDEYVTWPIFRWSKDDRYFARLGTDVLSVYETPGFGLLDKKSIKIPGIR